MTNISTENNENWDIPIAEAPYHVKERRKILKGYAKSEVHKSMPWVKRERTTDKQQYTKQVRTDTDQYEHHQKLGIIPAAP